MGLLILATQVWNVRMLGLSQGGLSQGGGLNHRWENVYGRTGALQNVLLRVIAMGWAAAAELELRLG